MILSMPLKRAQRCVAVRALHGTALRARHLPVALNENLKAVEAPSSAGAAQLDTRQDAGPQGATTLRWNTHPATSPNG